MANKQKGMRSLVCDGNGIIIAEMVYRCMICSEIHEVLDDAQRHYQKEHIEDNDDMHRNYNKKNNSQSMANDSLMNDVMSEDDDVDEDDLNCLTNEMPVTLPDGTPIFEDAPSTSASSLTVAIPPNVRQMSMHQSYSHHNAHNDINSMIINASNRAKPLAFASPSNTLLLPMGKPSPRKVGGGFVTCEVCGLTKYYSHISRRYGVFSCESCAKFFYRYLLKPSKFTCASNGNCSLKIDVPGGRCKSCLLQACLQKYIIDPKKHPKIFQKSASGDKSIIPINAGSIKINIGRHNPPPPKLTPALPHPKTLLKIGDIKLEPITMTDDDIQLSVAPSKTSANGVVIKQTALKRRGDESGGVMTTKTRRGGCRECPGCLADDCGQCLYCLDKPKFGGMDVKKQRCVRRRCHRC